MGNYSMPRYFQNMPVVGKPVKANAENVNELRAIEDDIHAHIVDALSSGKADEDMNAKGQLTAMQRIALLVDQGTWCPLNSLYNPEHNKNGSTSIVKGLGRVNGKWCCIIASDNKKHAGTWVPGQADNLLRGSDTAKRLRIPLIYLLECAGVELDKQEKVYPNRRGGGTPFYRNSELNQMGIPVIVGIHGTNPAGGGYHSISPTVLVAHQKANMAVGGAGIVGGMNPKPHVDMEAALAQIEATKGLRADPPGSVSIHYGETGFFREVYTEQEGVIAGIKKYVDMLPTFDLEFFRVDTPQSPAMSDVELYDLVLNNKNRPYDMYSVLGRLFDGSQFMEYKKGYGPEMITGIAKVDGLLVGVVANQQGIFPNYPEYKMAKYGQAMGAGGKLYRQGLIKMNEFVTLCARDRLPMVWIQDTTGIDVGGRRRRGRRAAGPGPVPDLLHPVLRPAHDGDYPPPGHRRRPLRAGRTPGQRQQRLLSGHRGHRDQRDERQDRRQRHVHRPPGQGPEGGQGPPAHHRQDERPHRRLQCEVSAPVLRPGRPGGRGCRYAHDAQLHRGLRRLLLPESRLHLPLPPDAAAAHHQGLRGRA